MFLKTMRFIVAVLFLSSCANYKKDMVTGNGSKKEAISNVIKDFYHRYKDIDKGQTFHIRECKIEQTNNTPYCFIILRGYDKYYILNEGLIGLNTYFFPSDYIEYKDKLFLIYQKDGIVTEEIINVLHNHKLLDSTILKVELGILPESERPVIRVVSDHREKWPSYFICKDNINKYLKKWSSYSPDTYPKMKCD